MDRAYADKPSLPPRPTPTLGALGRGIRLKYAHVPARGKSRMAGGGSIIGDRAKIVFHRGPCRFCTFFGDLVFIGAHDFGFRGTRSYSCLAGLMVRRNWTRARFQGRAS